jgi:hypothetical protein
MLVLSSVVFLPLLLPGKAPALAALSLVAREFLLL